MPITYFTAPQFGTVLNQEQQNQFENIPIEPATQNNIDALLAQQAALGQEVLQQQAVIQPQEVSDFVQRYKDTWVKASWEGKEPIVVFITGTTTNKGKSLVCALRGDNGHTVPMDKFTIQKSLPSSKFVNLSGGILYGSRVPERQWKRGVCKNTYLIHDPIAAQLNRLWGTLDAEKSKYDFGELNMLNNMRRGATSQFWQPTILDQFFDPVYPSYLDCWKRLKEGKAFAVAFHPQYCLSLSLDEENFVIIRRNSVIAIVDKTSPTNITPIDPIFKQELIDLSRKYLINVMVN